METLHIPVFPHQDVLQIRATSKHVKASRNIFSIESAQIERSQRLAMEEHITHVGRLVRIEVIQVEGSEALAVVEHIAHRLQIRSVKIAHRANGGEVLHFVEPIERISIATVEFAIGSGV